MAVLLKFQRQKYLLLSNAQGPVNGSVQLEKLLSPPNRLSKV
jgi:hypothetical protein